MIITKKENILRTIYRNNPEWVPYRYDSMINLYPNILVRAVDGGKDDWGTNWISTNSPEGSFPDITPPLTIDEISKYEVPRTDWGLITKDLKEKIKKNVNKDILMIVKNDLPFFERAKALLGMEALLINMLFEKSKVSLLLDKVLNYQIKLTKAIMKSGCKGLRFTDDWGGQKSMLFSPSLWRKLIKPGMKRLYEIVKNHGGLVFHHSCGHIGEIIPDLIEIGCDVIDPCQPSANDIFKWKREYGKDLSFMGGLDTQTYLSLGKPEEVKKEVFKVLSIMSKGGGYIPSPSHTITIPSLNRKAMLDAIDDFNKNTYTIDRANISLL